MRRLIFISAFGALILGALAGCSKLNSPESGSMSVRMTDAPGDFQAVNIRLVQISASLESDEGDDLGATVEGQEQVTPEDGAEPEGSGHGNDGDEHWTVLWSGDRMCDLLQLRNGVFTELASAPLPAGHYKRLRMRLGAGSNVVVNGGTYPLTVPRKGVKLKGRFNVPNSGSVDIALDFNVARSIVLKHSRYYLKPSIRVFAIDPGESPPGAIAGMVAPSNAMTWVYAIQGPDTVASTTTSVDGEFTVSLLPAGTYSVAFDPVDGYADCMRTGVVVSDGATTNVGVVELVPMPPAPGAIAGQVLPAGVSATVSALQGVSTIGSTSVDVDGTFTLTGLSVGTYSLAVHAESGFEDTTVPNVAVAAGSTTYVGTIQLTPLPPPPGALVGRVVPEGVPCTVRLMDGSTEVASTTTSVDGTFGLSGLPPGSYVLIVHPQFDFSDSVVNVEVRSGETTNVGDIPLAF